MSRIGKKPLILEPGIQVTPEGNMVFFEGPKGKFSISIPAGVELVKKENQIEVKIADIGNSGSSLQGLVRTLIQNALTGVKQNWTKTLELVGVGYRAQVNGSDLVLQVGFSHPVKIAAPEGISFQVQENKIMVTGVNKYLVGEVAASIKRVKPPEPYKGKGIKYEGEHIRKKLGKAAKTVGAAAAK